MPNHRMLIATVGIILVSAWCVRAAAQQPGPSQQRPATQPADATPLDPETEKILDRLEERVVHDLKAGVKWKLEYVVEEGDGQMKLGKLWYKDAEPLPVFKIQFDKKVVDRRLTDLDEQHLFDGVWYVEKNDRTKTITRRQVRRPDERVDPYKLGEGPFPLPFGQKKADILREFEVTRVERAKNDPPNTEHLRLVPREGTRTRENYGPLDFWVAEQGELAGLPVKVRAAKRDGTGAINSLITVEFEKVQLNTGFSHSVFTIETPPGYEEVLEPLPPAPSANDEQKERP